MWIYRFKQLENVLSTISHHFTGRSRHSYVTVYIDIWHIVSRIRISETRHRLQHTIVRCTLYNVQCTVYSELHVVIRVGDGGL